MCIIFQFIIYLSYNQLDILFYPVLFFTGGRSNPALFFAGSRSNPALFFTGGKYNVGLCIILYI